MTPKAKADELIEKYYQMLKDTLEVNSAFYYCKQCALIAVDEILSSGVLLDENTMVKPFCTYEQTTQYYQQVRTEIENP
jgi:hypothetical protein